MGLEDRKWVRHYDPGVLPEIPIPDITFTDMLLEGIKAKPQRPALHFLGRTITFKELDTLSGRFVSFLKNHGYGPGSVVGINLPNIPEYPIALTGALRAGCTVTGISPLLTPKELAYQLTDAGVGVLVILDNLFAERLVKIAAGVACLKHVVVVNVGDSLPWIKRLLGTALKKIPRGEITPLSAKEVLRFKEILSAYPPGEDKPRLSPEDTCLIQYTGGTTGMPKGAELSHRNLVANTLHVREWVGWEMGQDVLCSAFPFFHLAGLAFGMVAMSTANTQCLIPDPRNIRHFCNEIKNRKPTVMANVPTLYQMLLNEPVFKTLDFSMLKICVSGAAPFSMESIQTFEKVVGKGKVMEVYGMTEASPLLTMNPYAGKKKIGSVGVPVMNTDIKIVDLETRSRETAVGEPGELIARGPQVMKGYHNKPEETANTLRELAGATWLFTGDVARMDEDGFIYVVDRAKDMLIVGGYKVFSREVEETLYQHPDIEFCAIVGLPDANRPGSEIVKVVIQLKSASREKDRRQVEADIVAYCRENMAPYKVPKIVEVVDQMPLTAVGKVDKKKLR